MSTNRTALLLQERPLIVLSQLACAVGLNEAIVLQQLHYWLLECGTVYEGRPWVYNSYEQWQTDNFPFWSIPTIRRVFSSLERAGLIDSRVEYDRRYQGSHRNWYTINYDVVRARESAFLNGSANGDQNDHHCEKPPSGDQNDQASGDQNDQAIYTENTTENTKPSVVGFADAHPTTVRAPEPDATVASGTNGHKPRKPRQPRQETPPHPHWKALCEEIVAAQGWPEDAQSSWVRASKLAHLLLGEEATEGEVTYRLPAAAIWQPGDYALFAHWWHDTRSRLTLPSRLETLERHWLAWRSETRQVQARQTAESCETIEMQQRRMQQQRLAERDLL